MRKVNLFIAMSLDGYIADAKGGVDWIAGQGNNEENIDTYSEFIKDIDTVLMGWNTYYQVTTELSPNNWVYEGMTTYVFTHQQEKSTDEIKFTDENPVYLINKLKQQNGKDIWICGGADLIQQLIKGELVDKYYISIIPTLLGKGLRLFGESFQEQKLKLINTKNYNGIVDIVYERR